LELLNGDPTSFFKKSRFRFELRTSDPHKIAGDN